MLKHLAAIALLCAPVATADAQARPPIRPLGAITATSADTLGIIGHLRALPGGRVLVNDVARRRVVLLDSTLAVTRVVADSTSGTASAYGPRPGGLIAYRGDSTLFVDPASLSMLVIDADGAIARVMSVPRPQEVGSLTSISFGTPALDAEGRLVYRAFPGQVFRSMRGPGGTASPAPSPPDSAALVRLDLATRKVDTVAYIRIPRVSVSVSRGEDGQVTMSQTINPLPMVDEWAVTSDGRLAIVRGRDYRVEWIDGAGASTSTGRIPFDWQRLGDEDKVALIDSVKAQRARMAEEGGPGAVVAFGGSAGAGAPSTAVRTQVTTMMTMRQGAAGAPATTITGADVRANISYVSPDELPDFKPPFFSGALRADADGNLWIRTIATRAVAGGPVYDVISPEGELIDRVQVPEGREIRGFGPGGIVYLMSRGPAGARLEAARLQ